MTGGRSLSDIAAAFPSFSVAAKWTDDQVIEVPCATVEAWSQEAVPGWLSIVPTRFAELQALEDDWNGYGAPAPSTDVILAAFDRLGSVIPSQAPAPAIFPTALGGIQFEWTLHGVHIEVEYQPDATIEAWGEDSATEESWHGSLPAIKVQLMQSLVRLSQDCVVNEMSL